MTHDKREPVDPLTGYPKGSPDCVVVSTKNVCAAISNVFQYAMVLHHCRDGEKRRNMQALHRACANAQEIMEKSALAIYMAKQGVEV